MSYELGWRRLTDPARTASRAVVGQLGDKLLSAVKYVHRVDKFDDPAFPTQGALTCCSAGRQATAGLGHRLGWRGAGTAGWPA